MWTFSGFSNGIYYLKTDSNGNAVASSADNTMRKIGKDKGSELWKYNSSDTITPIVVDNNDYVFGSDYSNNNFKIDPNGNEVWRTSGSYYLSRATYDQNNYIYTEHVGGISKLDKSNGDKLWTDNSREGDIWALNFLQGYLYYGDETGKIGKLSQNGNLIWTNTLSDTNPRSITCDSEGNLYFSRTDNSYIFKINPEDGSVIWSTQNLGYEVL
mgnify:CR=1 FL=1